MNEKDPQQRLTLEDVRTALEGLKEEHEQGMSLVEVLYELARNKQELAQKISGNADLLQKFGDEAEVLRELDMLEQTYEDQIQTIEAGIRFGEKVEKQSWGTWALEKVKSVVKFPVRHPIIFLLILLAVLGALAGYMGFLPGIGTTFAGWAQKAKALLGLEGATAAAETAGAVEAASEAANVQNIVLRTFGHQIGFGDTVYEIKDIPALLDKLPQLTPGQTFDIFSDDSSRSTVERALHHALSEKYGEDAIRKVMGVFPY